MKNPTRRQRRQDVLSLKHPTQKTAQILRFPIRLAGGGRFRGDAVVIRAEPRTLREWGWPFPEATYGQRAEAKDPGTIFKHKRLRKAVAAAIEAFEKSGEMVDAALAYGAHGFPILPLDPVKKVPIPRRDKDENGNPISGTGGVYKASTDEKQIRRWWRRDPNALIGMPMGERTGIWALDVDSSEDHADGVAAWKKIVAKHAAIITREHRSATGGPHLIFAWDGNHPIFCSTGSLPSGIEVKGQGGYIAVPPSQRKGRAYTVHRDIDPIAAPQFLLELIANDRPRNAADPDRQLVASDFDEFAYAVAHTPNDLKGWKEWKDYCMAIYNASAGSDEGFEMFDEFSQRWTRTGKSSITPQQCWDEVAGCKPDRIGAGTVYMKASKANPEWRTDYQEQLWANLRAARQQAVDDLPPSSLDEVHTVFRKWFGDKYDLDAIDTVCAVGASERLTGDPAWLLIISGPGAAKTETAQSLSGAGAHVTSTIASEGALLSASPKKSRAKTATGGLLRKMGERGILVVKDVTTLLSSDRNMRGMVMAALREIHDGRWERNVGTDGGQSLTWTGRIVIVGAVTTAWDAAHGVIASLGDRFVLIRIDSNVSRQKSGTQAITNTGSETQMREELAAAVGGLIANANTDDIKLDDTEIEQLVKAADIVTMARTAVERDYRGDVISAHAPEMPTRFAKQLTQIIRGGVAIGMSRERAMRLAIRCARDSIPPLRLEIILDVAINPSTTVGEVRRRIAKPWATIKRELEGLYMLGILKCDERTDDDSDGRHKWLYRLDPNYDYKTLATMAGRAKPSLKVKSKQKPMTLTEDEAVEYVSVVKAAEEKAIDEIENKRSAPKPRGRGKR